MDRISNKEERRLTKKLRPYILQRDEYKCQVCNVNVKEGAEIHHIHALYLGGTTTEDNLVSLCGSCHKYAPETGKDEFNIYKKNKYEYITNKINNHPQMKNKLDKIVYEFLMMKLDYYCSELLLDRDSCFKIKAYELEILNNKLKGD